MFRSLNRGGQQRPHARRYGRFCSIFQEDGTKAACGGHHLGSAATERVAMFDLVRLVRQWLWPAAEQAPVQAEDASSMADLARLLSENSEPPGAETPDDEAAGSAGEA